jgi:hypothetical protein
MRSRSVWSMPAGSLMGFGIGLAAGVAAGLLAAPMRGADTRRTLRSRADSALGRRGTMLDEGRHALRTRQTTSPTPGSAPLAATLGEIAEMHSGQDLSSLTEAQS